jgi:hypothetical protein
MYELRLHSIQCVGLDTLSECGGAVKQGIVVLVSQSIDECRGREEIE